MSSISVRKIYAITWQKYFLIILGCYMLGAQGKFLSIFWGCFWGTWMSIRGFKYQDSITSKYRKQNSFGSSPTSESKGTWDFSHRHSRRHPNLESNLHTPRYLQIKLFKSYSVRTNSCSRISLFSDIRISNFMHYFDWPPNWKNYGAVSR